MHKVISNKTVCHVFTFRIHRPACRLHRYQSAMKDFRHQLQIITVLLKQL